MLRRSRLRKRRSNRLCLRKLWEIIKFKINYKMKTKKRGKRRIKRSKIKINLRRKSGDYSSLVKMLMHHHNKVSFDLKD